MLIYEFLIDPSAFNDEVQETVHHGYVGSKYGREVNIGFPGSWGFSRIDNYQLGRLGPPSSIQNSRPENGLGGSNIVTDMQDRFGRVDICVGSRLAVSSEGFLQGLACGCRAETSVAVHMRGPEPRFPDDRERVVFFEKQLS